MRRIALFLFASLVGAVAAIGCSYVDPPALTMADNVTSPPFYTLSRTDLLARVDEQQSQAKTPGGTAPKNYSTSVIADELNTIVIAQLQKRELEQNHVVVQQADRDLADQIAQQSGQSQPEQVGSQAELVALARHLGKQEVAAGRLDQEKAARDLYEQAKDRLTTPAEVCIHAIEVVALDDAAIQANPNATPTPDQMAAALAKAQAAKDRLATEPFDKVADDVAGSSQHPPGGDIGCISEEQLPPAATAAMANLAVNQISDPVALDASYAIIRIDSRKPASTRSFDEVKDQAMEQVLLTEGAKLLGKMQKDDLKKMSIVVDPRFGVWDASVGKVLPPPGASSPTVPTTPTTAFDPTALGLTPDTPVAPSSTVPATSTPPGTTSGTTPGTAPGTTPGTAPGSTAVPSP